MRNHESIETNSRMLGLGQAPSDAAMQAAVGCSFGVVPALEYVTWTVSLPLLDTTLQSVFGNTINVLNGPTNIPGIASIDTSFVVNSIMQTGLFAIGFGIHVFAEPFSFSQIGNSIPTAAVAGTAPPISPDVWTLNDLEHGALGPTSGIEPAAMEWGFADWQAAWHLLNAYQFRWRVMQRLYLIQELAADVAYFCSYADGEGMGTSDAVVQQYINQMNGTYKGLAQTSSFMPVNYRRVGSVNTGPTGYTAGPNVGVFHPTSDYKLAPISWGGLKIQGTGHQNQQFRKLPRPVYIPAGTPIGMTLEMQDDYHWDQMLRYMSISENNTAAPNTVASVSVGGNYSGFTATPAIGPTQAAGLELTLDTGGNQFAQESVNTDINLYKGGALKIAFLIKGMEVNNQWSQYFAKTSDLQKYIDMPNNTNAALSGVAR